MQLHRIHFKSWAISMALAVFSMLSATLAHAADGCKFLLCIAGPWSSISQCVPTVHDVFRDLARGRPFPTCGIGGANTTAHNDWLDASPCPSMYRQCNYRSGSYSGCIYPGRISVYVNGGLWSQVYWDMSANTSTSYSAAAQPGLTLQAGSAPLNEHFLTDLTGWNSGQVPQCQSGGGTAIFDAFGAFQRCDFPNSGGGG